MGAVPKDQRAPQETAAEPAATAVTTLADPPAAAAADSAGGTTLSAEEAAALQSALSQGAGSPAASDDADKSAEGAPLEVPAAFRSPAAVSAAEQEEARKLLQQQEEARAEVMDRISFRLELFAVIIEGGKDKACFGLLEYLSRLQNMPAGSPPVNEVIAKSLENGTVRFSWYFVDDDGAPLRELLDESSKLLNSELEAFVAAVREELTKATQAADQSAQATTSNTSLTVDPATLRTFLSLMIPEERELYVREIVLANREALSSPDVLKLFLDGLSLDQRQIFIKELAHASSITPQS